MTDGQLSMLLTKKQGKAKTNGIFLNFLNSSKNNEWILDSGATDFVTGNKNA
jgi:hypothetical protein